MSSEELKCQKCGSPDIGMESGMGLRARCRYCGHNGGAHTFRSALSRPAGQEAVCKALSDIRDEAGHQLTQLTSNHPAHAPFKRIRDTAMAALRGMGK